MLLRDPRSLGEAIARLTHPLSLLRLLMDLLTLFIVDRAYCAHGERFSDDYIFWFTATVLTQILRKFIPHQDGFAARWGKFGTASRAVTIAFVPYI